jgi:M6 family metalloprotease-like protein
MARMAIDSAHAAGANFALYAVNGVVQTIHIVFAGFGTEMGAPACQSIWSHAWSFHPPRILNGVSLSRFSTSPELRGTSGTNLGTIGVIVHELGHSMLGWPDSYSVRRGAGTGSCVDLGDWCVMASGAHRGSPSGSRPPRPSAWFAVDAGWVPEITLTTPDNIVMPNPIQTGVVYRINTNTANEYFLLENRQQVDWDLHIPSSGMLIHHVDRTPPALPFWANNEVLTHCNRRRLYVKQPGCGTMLGCAGGRANDSWPQSGHTEFTDISVPNARSWAGVNTNKPVTNITRHTATRTVSFAFMGGNVNVAEVPYFEGFEETMLDTLPSSWGHSEGSVVWNSAGNSIEGVQNNQEPRTGSRQMVRSWQNSGHSAWAFSQPVELDAEITYLVNFWYRAPGRQEPNQTDNFKVQIAPTTLLDGSGNAAQMFGATTIMELNNERVQDWTEVSVRFTPATDGLYYIGFHCMTPTQQGYFIAIDDISIVALPANDLEIIVDAFPYTQFPTFKRLPTFLARAKNNGTAAQTGIRLSATLNGNTIGQSPQVIFLPIGGTTAEMTFTPNPRTAPPGDNTLIYSVTGSLPNQGTDNTVTVTFVGTNNVLAIDNVTTFTDGFGSGTGPITFGNIFEITDPVLINGIQVGFGEATTLNYSVSVFAMNEALTIAPTALLTQTATRSTTGISTVDVMETRLSPGRYFVAVNQLDAANIAVSCDGAAEKGFYIKEGNNLTNNSSRGVPAIRMLLAPDPSSILGFEQDATLKVWPNPVLDGKLIVEIPENSEGSVIQIYDISGQLVLTRPMNHPKTEIDISHLPNGVYIVRVGHRSVRIIKQ